MKAYRTQSPYYFSSKRLLAVGVVVFFSDKIKRYVHPTEGILLDEYPRLQLLSEEEIKAVEAQGNDILAKY